MVRCASSPLTCYSGHRLLLTSLWFAACWKHPGKAPDEGKKAVPAAVTPGLPGTRLAFPGPSHAGPHAPAPLEPLTSERVCPETCFPQNPLLAREPSGAGAGVALQADGEALTSACPSLLPVACPLLLLSNPVSGFPAPQRHHLSSFPPHLAQ